MLSQQAMNGKFSLQNILSTDDTSVIPTAGQNVLIPAHDPIVSCLVNYQVAASLFDK
jgi:hypothetical protein